jgi:hypothetical protein
VKELEDLLKIAHMKVGRTIIREEYLVKGISNWFDLENFKEDYFSF